MSTTDTYEGFTIKKGGKLTKRKWNSDLQEYVEKDCEDDKIVRLAALFQTCRLDQGVTLRDVLTLVRENVEIYDLIFSNWTSEIIEEAFKEPTPPQAEDLEATELYWHFNITKYEDKTGFSGQDHPEYHGISPIREKDLYDKSGQWIECEAGTRTNYSLSFTPASTLLDIPLILRDQAVLEDEDLDLDIKNLSKEDFDKHFLRPRYIDQCSYTLFHILYGIMWELSWHGAPESRDAVKDEVFARAAEINKE